MKVASLLPHKGRLAKGHGRGHARLNPARVEMQVQALELRKQGLTYAEIGTRIGRSDKTALELVRAALLDTLQEPSAEVRALELRRLDGLWRRLQPKIKKGDLKAFEVALKIMARRAAFLGLDAPVTVQGPDGAPVRFVVECPPQAATIGDWQATAAQVLDVKPETEVSDESGL